MLLFVRMNSNSDDSFTGWVLRLSSFYHQDDGALREQSATESPSKSARAMRWIGSSMNVAFRLSSSSWTDKVDMMSSADWPPSSYRVRLSEAFMRSGKLEQGSRRLHYEAWNLCGWVPVEDPKVYPGVGLAIVDTSLTNEIDMNIAIIFTPVGLLRNLDRSSINKGSTSEQVSGVDVCFSTSILMRGSHIRVKEYSWVFMRLHLSSEPHCFLWGHREPSWQNR